MTITKMTPKKIVESFIASTNERNWNRAFELLDDNVKRHSSTYGHPIIESRGGLINFHKLELETFPDLMEKIRFIVCEKDMVATRINFQGTQHGMLASYPPFGRTLDADFNCFFRIRKGKIAESWVEYDVLNGLIQLGHINPSTDLQIK